MLRKIPLVSLSSLAFLAAALLAPLAPGQTEAASHDGPSIRVSAEQKAAGRR